MDLPLTRLGIRAKTTGESWSLYPILSWRTGSAQHQFGLSGPQIRSRTVGAGDGYLANADFAPGFSKITILNPKTNAIFISTRDVPGDPGCL